MADDDPTIRNDPDYNADPLSFPSRTMAVVTSLSPHNLTTREGREEERKDRIFAHARRIRSESVWLKQAFTVAIIGTFFTMMLGVGGWLIQNFHVVKVP